MMFYINLLIYYIFRTIYTNILVLASYIALNNGKKMLYGKNMSMPTIPTKLKELQGSDYFLQNIILKGS